MSEHKHEKVTIYEEMPDGAVKIVTNSYYEKLAHTMEEIEKQLTTSKKTLLEDIIECVSPLLKGSPRVTLIIEGKHNEPVRITKRVVTIKESFNRK